MSLVPLPQMSRRSPDLGADRAQQVDLLAVVERRRLAGAAGDDEAVGAVLEQVDGQLAAAARPRRRSPSNGVAIAVRTPPSSG